MTARKSRSPRLAFVAGLAFAVPLLCGGCAHITVPLDENLDATTLGTKTGRAEWQSVLGLVAWGDAGTKAAADAGGITTVRHADEEQLAILYGFIYYRSTTIVYGD